MSLHQHDLWYSFDSDHLALCQVIPGHSLALTMGQDSSQQAPFGEEECSAAWHKLAAWPKSTT